MEMSGCFGISDNQTKNYNKGTSTHPHSRKDNTGDGVNEDVDKAPPEHGIPPGGATSRLLRLHNVRSIKLTLRVQGLCILVEHGLR